MQSALIWRKRYAWAKILCLGNDVISLAKENKSGMIADIEQMLVREKLNIIVNPDEPLL